MAMSGLAGKIPDNVRDHLRQLATHARWAAHHGRWRQFHQFCKEHDDIVLKWFRAD